MKTITIAPNRPLTLALADPEGQFDHETGNGLYQTTAGELLTLPRPAVVALNLVEPRPGEEIRILKSWSGKYAEPSQWTIELTSRSEQARAGAGEPDSVTERLEAANETPEPVKAAIEAPTPIRRPAKQPKAEPQVQPRLFDTRGTGTHGPAPAMMGTDLTALRGRLRELTEQRDAIAAASQKRLNKIDAAREYLIAEIQTQSGDAEKPGAPQIKAA